MGSPRSSSTFRASDFQVSISGGGTLGGGDSAGVRSSRSAGLRPHFVSASAKRPTITTRAVHPAIVEARVDISKREKEQIRGQLRYRPRVFRSKASPTKRRCARRLAGI